MLAFSPCVDWTGGIVLGETNVGGDADAECAEGDDDPEELLAYANDAADPGEESHGPDGELGPLLVHFTLKVDEHSISVQPSVEPGVCRFVPFPSQSKVEEF